MQWLEWANRPFNAPDRRQADRALHLHAWPDICQAMDRETWGDPEVARLAQEDYVPIRVDADRRPDIYERYSAGPLPSTSSWRRTAGFSGEARSSRRTT